jgi:O-antigen/teichoic acid export membrane protein
MGDGLFGLFSSFQAVATLGGLGDLGMGGVVNLQTSRLVGQCNHAELRFFLSGARTMFLLMAVIVTGVLLALAPWLPSWLQFKSIPGAGSLPGLFAIGAFSAGFLILASYITNVNYGGSNLTWPVLPAFFLLQTSILCHWLLARQNSPLWLQYSPYLLSAVLGVALGWFFLRVSYPALVEFFPLSFNRARFLSLVKTSFWMYLYCLANGIYITTDRLLINAGFGAGQIPAYQFNYKLCEMAVFVIGSASLMSIPKIGQWLASPDAADRVRAVHETERLNRFQTFLGCGAALGYLAVNDWFIKLWLGEHYRVPLLLQAAFAANLAATASGLAGYELSARCGDRGLSLGATVVALTAVFNFSLSYLSMKLGSIVGIALATFVAQTCLVLTLGRFSYSFIRASWLRLGLKSWLLAVATVGFGYTIRSLIPMDSLIQVLLVGGIFGTALLAVATSLGIQVQEIRHELELLRGMLGAKTPARSALD